MPYATRALHALEAWRDAERRLAETPPDAAEYSRRLADVRSARSVYGEAAKAAIEHEPARRPRKPPPPPEKPDQSEPGAGT